MQAAMKAAQAKEANMLCMRAGPNRLREPTGSFHYPTTAVLERPGWFVC